MKIVKYMMVTIVEFIIIMMMAYAAASFVFYDSAGNTNLWNDRFDIAMTMAMLFTMFDVVASWGGVSSPFRRLAVKIIE